MSNDKDKISDDMLVFNGINGATGEYSLPPMTSSDLAMLIQGEKDADFLEDLREKASLSEFAVREGVDATDLSQTGWGVIFPADFAPNKVAAIKEALSDLLNLRQRQAGQYFRIFEGSNGYRRGDTKRAFLKRFKVGSADVVDPAKGVPYYLLLVGSPADIPYRFQFELDVQFAVGRIHFETAQEYANYAANVAAVEGGKVKLARKASFFGVANPNDRATKLSSKYLVKPLYDELKDGYKDWEIKSFMGKDATKSQLGELLGGNDTPALLFTASHGIEMPFGDSRQLAHQGALLCQDWPGPRRHKGGLSQDFYFAGDDLMSQANMLGLVAFCFSCYGAGTPQFDEFYKKAGKAKAAIAAQPFLANLPIKMLGKPNGALAVIGHVERAWGYSFISNGYENTTTFASSLEGLLLGHPVGYAVEDIDMRYATLATELSGLIEEVEIRKREYPAELEKYLLDSSPELVELWTEHNDARNYIIIGDPAVRLPVTAPGENATARPVVKVKPLNVPSFAVSQPEDTGGLSDGAEADFGWVDDTASDITSLLKDSSRKLVSLLANTIDDISSLEIQTYTSDDISKISYDSNSHKFSSEAKLMALTRVAFDGDMINLVPERLVYDKDGGQVEVKIDEQLWGIHLDMVTLAQENRVSFIKALAEVAGTLLDVFK